MPFPPLPLLTQGMPLASPQPALPLLARAHHAGQESLTEEEKQSILGWAAEKGLSGLEAAALALDKPGAAIRGTLSAMMGGPAGGGLMNLIPFSDTLRLTDPKERVYGRDLLTTMGLTPPNKPGFFEDPERWDIDWPELGYDVAGLATEIVLDPLTYVTGPGKSLTAKGYQELAEAGIKGVTKANIAREMPRIVETIKGAAKGGNLGPILGTTPAAMAEEIRQGLRAPIGFKLPGMTRPLTMGAGSEGAAKMLEWATYGPYSPTPFFRYLFSPTAHSVPGGAAQMAKDKAYSAVKNLQAHLEELRSPLMTRWQELAEMYGKDLAEYARLVEDPLGAASYEDMATYVMEKASMLGVNMDSLEARAAQIEPIIANSFEGIPPELTGKVEEFTGEAARLWDGIREVKDLAWERVQDLGGYGGDLDDIWIKHIARSMTHLTKNDMQESIAKLFSTAFPYSARRNWHDIPEGTLTLQRISRHPWISSTTKLPMSGDVRPLSSAAAGPWVYATDRSNYGRVLSVNQAANTAEVYFVSPEGAEATVTLSRDILKPIQGRSLSPLPKNQAELRAWLEESLSGFSPEATSGPERLHELQAEYLRKEILQPAYERDSQVFRDAVGRGDYSNWDEKELAKLLERVTEVETTLPSIAAELASYMRRLNPKVLQKGMFDRDMLNTWFDYMRRIGKTEANFRAMHHFLKGPHVLTDNIVDATTKEPKSGYVSLMEAWQTPTNPRGKPALSERGLQKLVADWYEAKGVPMPEKAIENLYVPKNTSKILQSFIESMQPRTELTWLKWFDKWTALTKGYLTTPFPGFHLRNRVSGMFQNWSHGLGSTFQDAKDLVGADIDIVRWLHSDGTKLGGIEPELAKEMIDMWPEMSGHRALDIYSVTAGEDIAELPFGGVKRLFEPFTPEWWSSRKATPAVEGSESWLAKANPLNIRGFAEPSPEGIARGAVRKQQNVVAELGERMYNLTEAQNRLPLYLVARRRGMTASQAMHLVKQVHFDYRELSGFEKTFMRRAIPFYSWSRKSIPYTLAKLIDAPGGRTAQTIRAMHRAQQESGREVSMPSWLKQGGAIYAGGPPENATVLRFLGIPVEDLQKFQFERAAIPDVKRTAERLLSETHPAIRAPLELMTGRGFYTGRELKHLKGPTGVPWLDTLIYATPGSRFVTTGRQLADERKGIGQRLLNIMTGIKAGTYDLEKWQLLELRDWIQRTLREAQDTRVFERIYIPKDKRTTADPEIVRLMEVQSLVNQMIQERAVQEQAG